MSGEPRISAELERYLSRQQLAEHLGVNVKTVDRWVAEGMPSETWGLRIRRFQLSKAMRWMRNRENETLTRRQL